MSSDWPLVQLVDLISIKHGFAFKGEFFSDTSTDTVLVTPGNFAIGGGFKADKLKFYSGPVPAGYKLKADDLIVTMTDLSKQADTLGYSALVPEHSGRLYLHNQRIGLVEIKSQELDKLYLYFLMRSREYRHHVVSSATGSTVKHTSPSKIMSFEFRLPPLETQKNIGRALKLLEERAEISHKINLTLEQMAQAIFKSWFVDFEPVKAKIAALEAGGSEEDALLAAMQAVSSKEEAQLTRMKTDQPEQYTELRATAELFPSAMQDSELGEVPEGWNPGTLHDVAKFPNERISTEHLGPDSYVSTENMLENKRGISTASSLPSSTSVPAFEPGQILISNIRPYFKKIWLANIQGGRSPDVLGFKCKHDHTTEFLFNLLYQDQFFDYMMLTSKGAKMPRGDKKAIMQFVCTLPPIKLMQRFSDRIKPFYTLSNSNNTESKLLEATREALLPKLLSGELSIPEAKTCMPPALAPAREEN
ncbi:restriction endonuclease subunit S [Marinobacter sp. F4216]|uniref:restriction endonuclease subunit S n=1 Tax=Marinobacter sp. F4216 TaxID=2874281 RepID=UPI001CBCAB04|nr:restriction endonuclease subunit S [Marinobacter sp. F4216]MBZ2169044.1 restriction endonuclease subunit S [Marinobacter sp. F4216]